MKPTFKNRENKSYKVEDKEIWVSRSPATVAIIFGIYKGEVYVLLEKRSETMRDYPGRYCLICGYLDWDETGYEGVIRETYEEAGLYLPDFKFKNNNKGQPFFVNTSPTENLQNVALHYCFIIDFLNELPNVGNYENNEIEKVEWVLTKDIKKYDLAFNHYTRIKQAIKKHKDILELK